MTGERLPTGSLCLLAALALGVGACGTAGSSPSGMDPSHMAPMPSSASAHLAPAASESGDGTAMFAISAGQIHADITVQQLTRSTVYDVHLHKGTCMNSGKLDRDLGRFTTDPAGAGKLHVEYAGTAIPSGFVEVHMPDGEGPAVCGELG